MIDERVKWLIGSGVGPAGGADGGSGEDPVSARANEEELNADGLLGMLPGIENWPDDKTEALLDKCENLWLLGLINCEYLVADCLIAKH